MASWHQFFMVFGRFWEAKLGPNWEENPSKRVSKTRGNPATILTSKMTASRGVQGGALHAPAPAPPPPLF